MSFAPNVSVRHHQISSAAQFPLSYTEYLPANEGIRADILLVHGLASSGEQFAQDGLHFAEKGFRVIVPDLRGHGLSGAPDGRINAASFTIPVMAKDLIDILDQAGARDVHWVGNSLGGILALWLLGTPERDRLLSLAVFGTCFSMNLSAQVSHLLRAAFLPGTTATAWITARTTTSSPVGRRAIETAIRQFNVDAGVAIAANVRKYDFVSNALAYERPLMVLWGGKDHAVNMGLAGDMGKFVDRPNFRRVNLPQGGHCANFDMPEAFYKALEQHWERAETASLGLRSDETL